MNYCLKGHSAYLLLRTHLVGRHGDGLLGVCAAGRRVAGGGCRLGQDDADQVSGDDAAGRQGLTGVRQGLRAVQRQTELCVCTETQTGNTGSHGGPSLGELVSGCRGTTRRPVRTHPSLLLTQSRVMGDSLLSSVLHEPPGLWIIFTLNSPPQQKDPLPPSLTQLPGLVSHQF